MMNVVVGQGGDYARKVRFLQGLPKTTYYSWPFCGPPAFACDIASLTIPGTANRQ